MLTPFAAGQPMDSSKMNSAGSNLTFDLEFAQIDSSESAVVNDITSKSLCTPGCGDTGTGNSFCCF